MTKVTRPGQVPYNELPPEPPGAWSEASIPFASYGGPPFIPITRQPMSTRRPMLVPPGGFAGFGQQTPATQQLFQAAGRLGATTRSRPKRRRKKAASSSSAPRRKRRSTTARKPTRARRKGKARLVKGSAAAKRYMAKIRRKRR